MQGVRSAGREVRRIIRDQVQPVVRMTRLLDVGVVCVNPGVQDPAGRSYNRKYPVDYVSSENVPPAWMAHIVFMLPESCRECADLRGPVGRSDTNE